MGWPWPSRLRVSRACKAGAGALRLIADGGVRGRVLINEGGGVARAPVALSAARVPPEVGLAPAGSVSFCPGLIRLAFLMEGLAAIKACTLVPC